MMVTPIQACQPFWGHPGRNSVGNTGSVTPSPLDAGRDGPYDGLVTRFAENTSNDNTHGDENMSNKDDESKEFTLYKVWFELVKRGNDVDG